MALDKTVFEPDAAWKRALEKYGAATRLTVELYGRDERLLFGPVHPTLLFELLAPDHHALEHGYRVRSTLRDFALSLEAGWPVVITFIRNIIYNAMYISDDGAPFMIAQRKIWPALG